MNRFGAIAIKILTALLDKGLEAAVKAWRPESARATLFKSLAAGTARAIDWGEVVAFGYHALNGDNPDALNSTGGKLMEIDSYEILSNAGIDPNAPLLALEAGDGYQTNYGRLMQGLETTFLDDGADRYSKIVDLITGATVSIEDEIMKENRQQQPVRGPAGTPTSDAYQEDLAIDIRIVQADLSRTIRVLKALAEFWGTSPEQAAEICGYVGMLAIPGVTSQETVRIALGAIAAGRG